MDTLNRAEALEQYGLDPKTIGVPIAHWRNRYGQMENVYLVAHVSLFSQLLHAGTIIE